MDLAPLVVLIAVFVVGVCGITYATRLPSFDETPPCAGKSEHLLGPWQDGEWEAKRYSKGLGKGWLTRMEMRQTRTCLDCGLTETRTTTRPGAPKARYLW